MSLRLRAGIAIEGTASLIQSDSMAERTGEQWLSDLRAQGPRRERALSDLRAILLRGLTRVLRRRSYSGGATVESSAEDFVQEALVRVLDNLDSYEGRSLFTTWAQKIAVRVALTELRRKRWQDVSLDAAPRSQSDPPSSGYAGPETRVDRKEAVAFVRRMMAEELTEKQQTAMRAVAFSGLPLTEVARRMGTNRNALYKLLHDARKRLKNRLSREGVTIEELLDTVDRE